MNANLKVMRGSGEELRGSGEAPGQTEGSKVLLSESGIGLELVSAAVFWVALQNTFIQQLLCSLFTH